MNNLELTDLYQAQGTVNIDFKLRKSIDFFILYYAILYESLF